MSYDTYDVPTKNDPIALSELLDPTNNSGAIIIKHAQPIK